MSVRRPEENGGPRRDGPVHKSLPNFWVVNILAPSPLATLPGQSMESGFCVSSAEGCSQSQSGTSGTSTKGRGHTNSKSAVLTAVPMSAAEPQFTCLVISNSWPTYFQKNLRWLTIIRRKVRITGLLERELKHQEAGKALSCPPLFHVAMDTGYL